MYRCLEATPGTVERTLAPPTGALVLRGSIGLVRLDERLMASPEPVRRGWLKRALIHEAVASLRLNDAYVATGDLTLMLADTLGRLPDQDLGQAVAIHRMLGSLTRRASRHLFRPQRLIALTQLRLRDNLGTPDAAMPEWLRQRRRHPEEMRDALEEALEPAAVSAWGSLWPLEAAGAIIFRWHATGAADIIGAAPGRALAMAWIQRASLTTGYYLLPSVGFLGHAADYRPDLEAQWNSLFAEACVRAADWGRKLHGRLSSAYWRLHEAVPSQRSTSRMAALVDLLVANPAVSADRAAESLQITPHAARELLSRLEKKGLVHELTGRGSFRLYGLPQ